MPIGYVEALKGDTDSTKSGRGGVVVEACKLTTASRSERPWNDVGMRTAACSARGIPQMEMEVCSHKDASRVLSRPLKKERMNV